MTENEEFFSSNGLTSGAFNACAECAPPAVAAPQPSLFLDSSLWSPPAGAAAPAPGDDLAVPEASISAPILAPAPSPFRMR